MALWAKYQRGFQPRGGRPRGGHFSRGGRPQGKADALESRGGRPRTIRRFSVSIITIIIIVVVVVVVVIMHIVACVCARVCGSRSDIGVRIGRVNNSTLPPAQDSS